MKVNIPIIENPVRQDWPSYQERPVLDSKPLEKKVRKILDKVRTGGDRAVKKYTADFDGVRLRKLAVTKKELAKADNQVPDSLKAAIQLAKFNIEKFHEAQKDSPRVIETMPGVFCWRESRAIEKVGIYIPGGTAPLFSTILMLAIPARIAGCREIILCSPPDKEGNLNPAILYTAMLAGITQVFKIGGVQAIGAMAYGTETVPAVYKIFGPGNQYVTCAKQLVQQDGLAIDMPAGPSEVAVLADATADPDFVAADLLSQAEHGTDSQSILVTTDATLPQKVLDAISRQLSELPRKEIAEKSLAHARMVVLGEMTEAIEFLNEYAAEHLIISCANARELVPAVQNAGSIFLGNYSPESAGDYASGTNHTLPTNGYAKAFSGVSVDSFVKKITLQEISPAGLENIGQAVEAMASAEGLEAHAQAIRIRLKKINQE